ncbi:MAG: hypothetical protein H7242_19100 [Microbacteriaceae bacterium]|nr:hypothetical protein [Burkholderiaceae bacterium]
MITPISAWYSASVVQTAAGLPTYHEVFDGNASEGPTLECVLQRYPHVRVPDLSAQQIVARYKSLDDTERGFRVLKSEIETALVFHRLPQRSRADASIFFLALVLHRVMRQRMRVAGSILWPEAALHQLRRVQHHRVRIDGAEPVAGISTIHHPPGPG